jgi:hypothetical protein
MVLDVNPKGYGQTLADSAVDALSPMNLLKRILLFLVFGFVLGLKKLIQGIDAVGQSGGGWWQYFKAIGTAMWSGVVLALGSMWAVIVHPGAYLESHSYGSIGFALFSLVFLVAFFYQPVSLVINIFDMKRGHATGIALRVFVTAVIVIILSGITYYSGDGTFLTTPLSSGLNETVLNVTNTTASTGGTVISLL